MGFYRKMQCIARTKQMSVFHRLLSYVGIVPIA